MCLIFLILVDRSYLLGWVQVRVKKLNKYVCEIASTGSEKEPGANDHLAKTVSSTICSCAGYFAYFQFRKLDLLATFCDKGSFRDRGYKMGSLC